MPGQKAQVSPARFSYHWTPSSLDPLGMHVHVHAKNTQFEHKYRYAPGERMQIFNAAL